MKGSEWIESVRHLGTDRAAVMQAVLAMVRAGHAVKWPMQPIQIGDVVLFVAMDYFAIGNPLDFVRVPLDAPTAQMVADLLGYCLPTPKIVDHIWKSADCKLSPLPMTPPEHPYDSSMFDVERFEIHNEWIEDQIADHVVGRPMALIFAGHKKDVVISNKYHTDPTKLCLYGWQRDDGTPIQGPYVRTHHCLGYYDYSHGVRMIGKIVKVRGIEMPYAEALQNPSTSYDLSDEGSLRVLRVPGVAVDDEPSSVMVLSPGVSPGAIEGEGYTIRLPELRTGSRGVLVERWQRIVGCTADGIFGSITASKTIIFQKASGLPPTGYVDQATWSEGLEMEKRRESQPPDSYPLIELPEIEFVQARAYRKANRTSDDILWIPIHVMQAAELPNTAENVADWFAGPNHPNASAHYNVDCDSIVQSVREKDIAWHARSDRDGTANVHSIGVEFAGYSEQDDAGWSDDYSVSMLQLGALLFADICKRRNLPIAFVDVDGIKERKRGITYHKTITEAFGVVGGHYDPGKHFPIEKFLEMIRAV